MTNLETIKTFNNQKQTFLKFLVKYGVFIAIALVFIFFSFSVPGFFSVSNFVNILQAISITTLIAVAITVSLPVDGINLAAVGAAGVAMALSAGLMILNEAPLVLVIIIPIVVSSLISFVVAFLAVKFQIDDLLAALALLFIAQGIELTYTGGQSIYPNMLMNTPEGFKTAPGTIPDNFLVLGQGHIGIIPVSVIIMLIIVILIHFLLNNTKYGRFMYATGGNPEAARLAGIPVNRYKIYAYLLSGIVAGIAGLVLTSRLGSCQSLAADSYFLESFAAAFIGFAVLAQGKANVFGTFVGAAFMGIMTNGLTMMNVPYTAQNIFKGLILVGALILSKAIREENS